LISTVDSVEILDSKAGDQVGAIRKVKWKSGETRSHQLLELSDLYHYSTWELIDAEPPTEIEGKISSLRLKRITETNQTLVEWSAEFSADVKGDLVVFEQKAFAENLKEMRDRLSSLIKQ